MNALLPCDCTFPSDLHCHRNGTHPRRRPCHCCCCCWVRLFSATLSAWCRLSRIVFKEKKQQHHNMQQHHVIAELVHVWYAAFCDRAGWCLSRKPMGAVATKKIWLFSTSTRSNVKSVMFSTSWRKVTLQEASAQWHFFEKTSGKCWQTLDPGLHCYTVSTPRFSGCPSVFRLILSDCCWTSQTEGVKQQNRSGNRWSRARYTPWLPLEGPKMLGLPVVSPLNERSWTRNHSWRISPAHSDAAVPSPADSFHFSRWSTKCLLCAWLLAPPLAGITTPGRTVWGKPLGILFLLALVYF